MRPYLSRAAGHARPGNVRDGAVSENTLSLNKTFVLFGMAVLTMIAFAVIATMPTAGRLMARERAPAFALPYRTGVAGSGLWRQPLRGTPDLRRRLIGALDKSATSSHRHSRPLSATEA